MLEAKNVKCTAVIGDTLWGLDLGSMYAVVWDQKRASFRLPTQQEQMGANAFNARQKPAGPSDTESKDGK